MSNNDNKDLELIDDFFNHILLYSKGKLKWKLETLPHNFLSKSAEELEKEQKITTTDKKLKLSLHKELQRSSQLNEPMVVGNICKGICHTSSFAVKLDSPEKLAWLLIPYQDEQERIVHQVNEAHDAVESLLHIDIYYRDPVTHAKKLDHKAAELKFKAAKLLYDRAYPATQKIAYSTTKEEKNSSKLSIEEKIKLLEKKVNNKNE